MKIESRAPFNETLGKGKTGIIKKPFRTEDPEITNQTVSLPFWSGISKEAWEDIGRWTQTAIPREKQYLDFTKKEIELVFELLYFPTKPQTTDPIEQTIQKELRQLLSKTNLTALPTNSESQEIDLAAIKTLVLEILEQLDTPTSDALDKLSLEALTDDKIWEIATFIKTNNSSLKKIFGELILKSIDSDLMHEIIKRKLNPASKRPESSFLAPQYRLENFK